MIQGCHHNIQYKLDCVTAYFQGDKINKMALTNDIYGKLLKGVNYEIGEESIH
jgi:hypothetical protein